MGAGLEPNHGSMWGLKVWNAMTEDTPNSIFSMAQSTANKAENQQKRKQRKSQRDKGEKSNTLIHIIQ